LSELAGVMNEETFSALIQKEAPEFAILVGDFQETLDTLHNKLKPLLEKARS